MVAPDIATYLPDVVLEAFDEELVVVVVVVAVAAVVVGETCEGANERERTAGKGLSLKSKIVVQLSGKGFKPENEFVVHFCYELIVTCVIQIRCA